jgi:2,3-diketo-5-methylthio-1-phosphopentane phosphatase
MQRVFDYLQEQQVSPDALRTTLEATPWAPSMQQLMQHLQQQRATIDCIILSDSNSLFIPWILDSKGHTAVFKQIYTNPAVITPQGSLSIQPCHAHSCSTCAHNMCKQQLLRDFLQQAPQQQQQQDEAADSQSCGTTAGTATGRPYRHICYVGDGSNDLCPAHLLQPQDALFVRKGYALERLVQSFLDAQASKQQQQQQQQQQCQRRASTVQQQQLEEEEQQHPEMKQLQSEVHFWDDAADIVAWLSRLQLQ